jgi:hypothetical protein
MYIVASGFSVFGPSRSFEAFRQDFGSVFGSQISIVTIDRLMGLIRELGWDVELVDTSAPPQLLCLTERGLSFTVSFGTLAAEGWIDFTLSACFPADEATDPPLSFWNSQHRFGRVHRTAEATTVEMVVVVAGGVNRSHLKYQLAIWADLLRASSRFFDEGRFSQPESVKVPVAAATGRASNLPSAIREGAD